jgi:hypothetical protein
VKTKKAFGLWNPETKTVDAWSVHGSREIVREAAVYELTHRDGWPDFLKAGYRVIPVTISFEPPKPRARRR